MKKFILLALVAAFFATACAQKTDNSYQRQHQQSDKAHKELDRHSKW